MVLPKRGVTRKLCYSAGFYINLCTIHFLSLVCKISKPCEKYCFREMIASVKSQGFPQTTSSRSMRQNKSTALDKRDEDWENCWAANSKTTSEDVRRPRKPVISILGDSMDKKIRR